MKKVKWGIIAPGNIAEKFADAINVVDNAELYAVASRSPERSRQFAQKFGAQKAHEDYQQLVQDDLVDAIYVASPHSFHAEQAILALSHRKPVLCEKPMTVNAAQAEAVFDVAYQHQVFCMEALWTRFLPTYNTIFDWLDDNRIGELKMIKADFGFSFPFDPSHRLFNPELAGGALLDLGIYPISFAQIIMRDTKPVSIKASGVVGETEVDESLAIHLKYPDGVIASLTTSSRANTNYCAEILGTKGMIRVPYFWSTQSAQLIKTVRTESDIIETADHPHICNGYEWEIMETHRCLRQGLLESPSMPWQSTLQVMRIMDEIRQQVGVVYPFE